MENLTTPNKRRYDIDTLRVFAFLLLIVYHSFMVYVPDWGFHIKSQYQSEWLKFPMLLINRWRMPLLFLISGIASSFILRKLGTPDFLKTRSLRLLLPFAIGVILIIPPQAYIQATANGSIHMSYWEFTVHYFTFQPWPTGAFDGSSIFGNNRGFTWNHLWFIPYLFTYTLFLIPIHALHQKFDFKIIVDKTNAFLLLLAPVALQIIWQLTFNDEKPISHAYYDDGYAHAMYATFFLLGYLISDHRAIWQLILRLRWLTLISAIITYLTLIVFWWAIGSEGWLDHLEGVIETFNQWLWLLAVLGWAARWLNKPRPWLSYANASVYPWYIFHQTITIIAAYFLGQYALGGLLEGTLVIVITLFGCFILTEFVVRRSKLLKPLFGMK